MSYKTQTYSKKSKVYFLLVTLIVSLFIAPVLNAQVQDFDFSGNSADSYQCFNLHGDLVSSPTNKVQFDAANGEFYCIVDGVRIKAVLKPPALQELEILFVRVVYAIWALVATFSFLLLVYLAYQYLISRGDATQVKAIRERIIKYIIGFALVFLAVPILVTFFKLLGVNNTVQCYQGLSGDNNVGIGFQFFFTDLCTDPKAAATGDLNVCADLSNVSKNSVIGTVTGIPCSPDGDTTACTTGQNGVSKPHTYGFKCVNSVWRYDKDYGNV